MTIDHLVRVGQVLDGSMGNIICPSAGESLGKLGVGSSYMSADDCAPPYMPHMVRLNAFLVRSFADLVRSYICSSGESV